MTYVTYFSNTFEYNHIIYNVSGLGKGTLRAKIEIEIWAPEVSH